MKLNLGFAVAGLIACACASSARAATFVVDDFESYTDGQLIASSFNSSPWLRFGQVDDGLYASTTSAMTGAQGAEIPVAIVGGGAVTARHFAAATNLSSYATATVQSRSKNGAPSRVGLQLSISDGTTTYLSNDILPLTSVAATYTFPINEAAFFLADGSATYASVLNSVTAIGFRMSNPTFGVTNSPATETISFDQFTLQTAVPEPTAVGVISAASVVALKRRRR